MMGSDNAANERLARNIQNDIAGIRSFLKGLLAIVFVALMIMSASVVVSFRTSQGNHEILKTVERCVLPTGDLCKGDPNELQALVDKIVREVNAHTDLVVNGNRK